MRPSPRLLSLLLVVLAVLGLATVACRRLAAPGGWAPPASANNLLFVTHKDKLYALDPSTLQEKWQFPGSEDRTSKPSALYGSLASADGLIFVPGYDGKLYTVAADTGKVRGQAFPTGGPLVGGVAVSPAAAATPAGETVYFGSSDGKLYAVDIASGQARWTFEAAKEFWSTPVVIGDTVYATSLDGRLYAIDAATGQKRWSYETAAGVASPPVVDELAGLVYVGGFDSTLRAIDLNSHQQRWQIKAANWFWTRPLVADSVVYAGSLDGNVYAVETGSGKSHWPKPFSAKAPVHAAPVLTGGRLIVVDGDGHVYALNPTDGSLVAGPLAVGGSVPADPLVLADGNVALVTSGGAVFRIDPATLTIVNQRKL